MRHWRACNNSTGRQDADQWLTKCEALGPASKNQLIKKIFYRIPPMYKIFHEFRYESNESGSTNLEEILTATSAKFTLIFKYYCEKFSLKSTEDFFKLMYILQVLQIRKLSTQKKNYLVQISFINYHCQHMWFDRMRMKWKFTRHPCKYVEPSNFLCT